MSLNLNIPTTFELPVTIKIPQADDIKVDFIAARKTIKEFEALRADAVENNTELTDIDFLSQLIVGWSLCDKDGKDIEFNRDNLQELLELAPFISLGIVNQYVEASRAEVSKN